ncbi:MAG: hypothetical protein PHU46_14060 [Rhodocyclaceae bacterium]|nr:hypothetical protein [Rhodocyclaceae bacterium]
MAIQDFPRVRMKEGREVLAQPTDDSKFSAADIIPDSSLEAGANLFAPSVRRASENPGSLWVGLKPDPQNPAMIPWLKISANQDEI